MKRQQKSTQLAIFRLKIILQQLKPSRTTTVQGSEVYSPAATKIDMFDQLQEITDYVNRNIDAAISEAMDNTTLAW